MNISERGIALIKSFESYMRALPDGRCQAYQCVIGHKNGKPIYDGKQTIGWGTTEGVSAGMIWTREQAEDALHRELSRFEAAVTRLVTVEINQNQYDALVSFAYNCGEGALAKSSILRKLNAGDAQGAADAFSLYNKSRGIEVRGLVRRRAAERALFLEPVEEAAEPEMPQTVDPPAPAEAHREAHDELKQESWLYSIKRRILELLGYGTGAGTIGFMGSDDKSFDPVSAAHSLMSFAKLYGFRIAVAVFAIVVAVELTQFIQREKKLGGGAQ